MPYTASTSSMPHHLGKSSRKRALAYTGLILATLSMGTGVLAGIGHRAGLWEFPTGLTMLKWACYIAVPALLISVIASFLARPPSHGRVFIGALLGVLISASVIATPATWLYQARRVPPIHDITTDTGDPPLFQAVLAMRRDTDNSADYAGETIAVQQKRGYPDISPLPLGGPPEQIFQRALTLAKQNGWDIVAAAPAEGRIEATATTLWFGFKDDIVIRIRPVDGGSRVDVRSASRVGVSDVGTNAARIKTFLRMLKEQID